MTDFQPFVTWRHLYYQWSIFTILIFKHPSCEALRLSICVALKNSSISQKASFINRLWRGFYLLKLNKQARYGYKKLCTLTISKTQIKSKFRIHHSSNRNWKLHSAITYNYYCWIDVLDTLIEPIFFGGIYTYNVYYASTYVSYLTFLQVICLTAYHTQVETCIYHGFLTATG